MQGVYKEKIKEICVNTQNRFRQIPTFSRFTIRCFHNNVSEMKKLAAHDFEDILQVHMQLSDKPLHTLTPISVEPVFYSSV